MSSLREKLLRHKKAGAAPDAKAREADAPDAKVQGAPDAGERDDTVPGHRAAAERPLADASAYAAQDEWQAVGAHMEASEWGSFVLRRRIYAAGYRHGKYELQELSGQAWHLRSFYSSSSGRKQAAASLPSGLAMNGGVFHERLLFLDTETTGLGLGAGNVPFMVGIGYYRGGDFTVEQMLIRDPGEEIAMLAYLQEKLRERPVLISYNGKSFDWPVVKNRYIINRMTLLAEPEGHIDFLYPSRSLWKRTLPSCRLGNVEEERLLVHRDDDVPGSLAPALYFQYLAEKDPSLLKGVFVHNELDILSLAGLAVHFTGVMSGRIDWRHIRQYGYEEWFRTALWLDKVGQDEAAETAMNALTDALFHGDETDEEALEQPYDTLPEAIKGPAADSGANLMEPHDRAEAGMEKIAPTLDRDAESADGSAYWLPLAQYYKRHGRYGDACRLWKRYIDLKGERSTALLEPYIELSMYYEHREKQWETALQYAQLALDKLRQRDVLKRSGMARHSANRSRLGETPKKGTSHEASADEEAEGLRKRIARLERKAASARTGEAGPNPPRARSGTSKRSTAPVEQLSLPLSFEQSV